MAYGTIKVDTITFTNGGVDKSVTISGLVQNPTFTGNVTVTGTVSGTTAIFTTGTFTTLTGGVATITSGVFALGTAALPSISFEGSDTDTGIYSPGANQVAITTSGSGRLFVNASGNIGIGTANPVSQIHIQKATAGLAGLHISNSTHGSTAADGFFAGIDDNLAYLYNYENLPIVFGTNSTERLRIHGDGKIGIGTTETINRQLVLHDNTLACLALQSATTGSADNDGFQLQLISSDVYIWNYENGFIAFGTNSQERMQIDSSGRLLVGTSSSSAEAKFIVQGGATAAGGAINIQRNATTASAGSTIGFINFANSANNVGATISADGDGTWSAGTSYPTRLVLSTTADGASSPTERMRISNNGIVIIKTSANDIAVGGTLGTTIAAVTRSGIHFGTPSSLIPTDGDGALTDNACSLGIGAYRWSTVYAGTGTINTSDATLKQDITDLGQAELNVAATIKTLIKKFRFVDAVASKGDDARIHVGVVAQEVEQAFVDEGLDPRRYAMFCEDTLDDGSKRLGIRYDELLAFVIAAL